MSHPPQSPVEPSADVGTVAGGGRARREAFRRLGVETVEDLLRLAPRRYEDRRHPTPIALLEAGTTCLVVGSVLASRAIRLRGGLTLLEATLEDESGVVEARWFQRGFLPRPLVRGARYALYGSVRRQRGHVELSGPQRERLPEDGDAHAPEGPPGAGTLVPVHPLTRGLSAPAVRQAVWRALPVAARVEDVVPRSVSADLDLMPLDRALQALHFPATEAEAEAARRRLAFDELLLHELLLLERRARLQRESAWPIPVPARLDRRIRARLPFTLTPGQDQALDEIVGDLGRPHPMNRLLQGDVGSGKTAVAAYALLAAVAARLQGVFMAPTEVLVRQHQETLERLLEGSRVRILTLTGGSRGKARHVALEQIAAGEVDIVLGTHAVLSADVRFARLGLVVVDEQHKFGVRQRGGLLEKADWASGASRPHALVMTATPIPRTLALTVYGDLDLSVIEGLPPGRKPVETVVVQPEGAREVFARVKAELEAGHQAFVIYPLVEESDRVALKDAVQAHASWQKALPDVAVGLVHGRLGREEKEAAMDAFRRGQTRLLVATVVIEVGVDVPAATVLVVEHAERFGLSQLHQLRGRIGRGTEGGLCFLMDRSTAETPARLDVLARTEDGFEIAEEDLKLRGVGDLLGTRQHGSPGFVAARLPRDLPVLLDARRHAQALVAVDPDLAAPPNRRLARRLGVVRARHAAAAQDTLVT